jgi:hypothetical protein
MMKRSVVLGLALLGGSLSFPQQPAEWRPNIADDNKAATWEDTRSFLIEELAEAHSGNGVGSWDSTGLNDVPDVTSPQRGQLVIHQRHLDKDCSLCHWNFKDTYSLIDFAKLDPLSIKVVVAASTGKGSPSLVVLMFDGTTGFPAASWHTYSGQLINRSTVPKEGDLDECKASAKKCVESTGTSKAFELDDFDMETAHRVARALQHAALLSGGSKAVSPF